MAFGSIMRLPAGELTIELSPLNKDVMGEFIQPGLQSANVTKYLETKAKVLEDEYEWYEKARNDDSSHMWGVWIVRDQERELIGSSSLHNMKKDFFYQAGSGSLIFNQGYWGNGIASAMHQARTWYAFHILGIDRIWSEVVQGNVASRRALEKSGYYVIGIKRNAQFAAGKMCHVEVLECINPRLDAWKRWWGDDRPTKAAREARARTLDAMKWASQNVTL